MAEEEDICPEEFSAPCMLGFLERDSRNLLFDDPDCANWDGGRVGGAPVWLDRVRLPSPADLSCTLCESPLAFLLQIYCPLDEPEAAYHRCLYLFCCRKASCVRNASVKCLRIQFSKDDWEKHKVEKPSVVCRVCGCGGTLTCSRCREAHYCSKTHQKVDWSTHKQFCTDLKDKVDVDSIQSHATTSVQFPEYDMVVEREVIGDELLQGDESEDALKSALEPDEASSDEDEDAALTQTDYDRAIGAESKDPTYVKFLARVRRGGLDQVLRYTQPRSREERDPEVPPAVPLAVGTGSTIELSDVPVCQRCGAQRQFEFQVLPQLLYYLNVDRNTAIVNKSDESSSGDISTVPSVASSIKMEFNNPTNEDIDWNSIDVYTCSANCSFNDSCGSSIVGATTSYYIEEFVHMQKGTI